MALTLGNPTLPTATRDALANNIDDLVNTGSGTATIVLIDDGGLGDLVEIDLQNPAFGASSTGVITLAGVPLSGTASAGSATTPDKYEIRDRDGAVVADGAVTGVGPITSGDTVDLSGYTWTQPAS